MSRWTTLLNSNGEKICSLGHKPTLGLYEINGSWYVIERIEKGKAYARNAYGYEYELFV